MIRGGARGGAYSIVPSALSPGEPALHPTSNMVLYVKLCLPFHMNRGFKAVAFEGYTKLLLKSQKCSQTDNP